MATASSGAQALRVHRGLSWLGRAEAETDDPDVRFILLWVAFNAIYAGELDRHEIGEKAAFRGFFSVMAQLDGNQQLYSAVWKRFPHEIRLLLDNPYVFEPFWRHHNGEEGPATHAERPGSARAALNKALGTRDTPSALSVLFDRLYVLRNQLVHGGATWSSTVNRAQVRDGTALLGTLVPIFIALMMDHPDRDWGRPYYPVVD